MKKVIAPLYLVVRLCVRQAGKTTSGNSSIEIGDRHILILDSNIRAVDSKTTRADSIAPGSDRNKANKVIEYHRQNRKKTALFRRTLSKMQTSHF